MANRVAVLEARTRRAVHILIPDDQGGTEVGHQRDFIMDGSPFPQP